VYFRVRKTETESKLCSRCRTNLASTAANAYCKPCRAAYQRAWRARRKGLTQPEAALARPVSVRIRLRGTPTRAEMLRYGLI
jgi:hypothetical protein